MKWCLWSKEVNAINLSRSILKSLSYRFSYYVINWCTLLIKSICQISFKELLQLYIPWSHVFRIIWDDTLFRSHEIPWYLYWEYYHQSSSIVTQFIGIYDHINVSSIDQSLLFILTQTQYPLKVESICNIVA